MPEETQTLELSQTTPNAAEHNADIATKLAEQGRDTLKPETLENLDTKDALENLRAATVKKKTEDAAAAKEESDETPAPVVEKKDPPKEASDTTVAPAKETSAPAADDVFSAIHLPPNIKPKSAEAFEKVKTLGREQIAARDAKLAELEAKLSEFEEKSKLPPNDDVLKELEEHRTFRAKLDIEADPRFKQFDKDISDTHNFIYSQLLKTGKITQEHIDQIKKYGGPSKVNLEKIFEAVNDPAVRRTIESKVADEEMLLFKKEQAIKEKKDDVAGYLKEREEAFSKATQSHNEATHKQFSNLVAKMDWTKSRDLPKDADDATKAAVKAHNEFVSNTKKDLDAALRDDSPEMRAILLAGMGQLLNLQRVHEGVNKKLADTQKQLDEATAKLAAIKNAGKSRLPESSAPPNIKPVEVKKDNYATSTGDSLEEIRKQIIREKAEKAAA